MAIKAKLPLLVLFFTFIFLFASLAFAAEDPELKQCKDKCRAQQQSDPRQRQECEERCERNYEEKQRRGREEEGGRGDEILMNTERPEEKLRECQRQCDRREQQEQQRSECRRECQEEFRREQEERGGGRGREESDNERDPEQQYRQCKQQCQRGSEGREQQRRCEQRCEREYREQEERGGGRGRDSDNKRDPEQQFRQCKQQCQRQTGQEQQQRCEQRCEREYRERDNLRDPEQRYRQCKQQCQRETGREQQRRCEQRCEREYREQEERGRGRESDNRRDPEQQYRQCKQQCQRETEGREQQRRCEQRCERDYRERQRDGEGNPRHEGREEEEEEEYEGQGKPYVFEDQDFTTKVETEHGRFRVLQKFSERSKLLRGIENYRVEILEAEPHTFILPKHCDADELIFVANGRGAISLVHHDKRESFNLRRGDVLRIQAGTTVHMINRANNEKLVIVKLLQPVSTPGHFELFFGIGGEDPESYYKAFSNELLEAALNTRRDKFQRIFGQQRRGAIIKASEEQIRALSHHEEGGGWPFGGESRGRPFNLFRKRDSQSNQYGQLYEVEPKDSKELEELNLGIGFANITQGSMIAPYYNSRATKIAIVTGGEGHFEMVCPHLSSSEHGDSEGRRHGGGGSHHQGRGSQSYQRVSARLRRGVVYVVPAGHPVIAVASQNQNLEILCFDVNARNNEKFFLAGRRNIMNHLEPEAKELGFGVPAREVDEVFKNQEEEFFLRGPEHQDRGRADA